MSTGSGSIQSWQSVSDFYSVDRPFKAADVTVARDGSAYAVGAKGGLDATVTKYASTGKIEWTKVIGTEAFDQAWAVVTDEYGYVYVAGYTGGSLDGQPNAGRDDAFLVKLTADGNRVWTRLLGTAGYEVAYGLSVGSGGAIFVAGKTSANLDGQTNAGGMDAFLTKYSLNGEKAWTRLIGTTGDDVAVSAATASDGSVYVVGTTAESLLNPVPAVGWWETAFVSKFDTSGVKVWTRTLDIRGGSADSVAVAPDGSLYVAGYTNGNYVDQQFYPQGRVVYLTKFTPLGEKIWTQTITQTVIGAPQAADISIGLDGSIYLHGYTNANIEEQINQGAPGVDGFLAK